MYGTLTKGTMVKEGNVKYKEGGIVVSLVKLNHYNKRRIFVIHRRPVDIQPRLRRNHTRSLPDKVGLRTTLFLYLGIGWVLPVHSVTICLKITTFGDSDP